MSQIMLKVDHAHTQYRERKFYFLSPIHWNSHERTMTKIKAQQRQIQKQLHLFLKRCENNVNWRELCFAFACSTTQTMLMNYTVNWNIILSVRDWGNLDVGLSDNERQLKFLEELRNWHMKIIIIDFTVFTGKYYGRNPLFLTVNPGRKGIRIPGVKISSNPSKL